ncbi:glycosyltransferase [Cohaesibacter intestini]|uniref:glycosyltransferase n=1 Tax=Cohaesibacter intestini TaxID=2211145 RepID=UPI0013007AE0|nr:glycosyltransferase [Cohaesibacter intestini]
MTQSRMTMRASVEADRASLFKSENAIKVCLFVIDAGAGHRATANAIREYLPEDQDVELVFANPYKDVLSRGSWFERIVANHSEAHYNFLLKHSRLPQFAWRVMSWLPLVFRTIRGKAISRLFQAFYAEAKPDLVICVLPFIGIDVIEEAERAGLPNMMVVTDHSETYRNSWIPASGTHLVAFSERGYHQGRDRAITHVTRISGPVLRRAFFRRSPDHAAALKRRLGLFPDAKTVLVFYGGNGSPKMIRIAQALEQLSEPLNVIFVCGHNKALKQELAAVEMGYQKRVFGFVRNIGLLMELSDVMIGKPGPGSAFEAVAKGVRTVLEVNAGTMPHELDNARMIAEAFDGASFCKEADMLSAIDAAPRRQQHEAGIEPPFRSDLEFSKVFNKFLDEAKG